MAGLRQPLPLVAAVVFALTLSAFMRIPLLPDIGRELDLSVGQISLITASFGLGRLLTDLPAGLIADRVAPIVALVSAALVLALGSALMGVAQSLAPLLVGIGAVGVASAIANTTGMTVFSTGAPAQRRGAAMAIFSTALMGGQMLGPAIGGVIGDLASWRTAQLTVVAIGVGVALTCLTLVPRSAARRRSGEAHEPEPVAVAARPGRLSASENLAIASVGFSVFFALGALPQTLVPLIGASELGLSTSLIGGALGVAGLSRLLGGLATGVISDRTSRKAALIPSLVLMAASIALLALPLTSAIWLLALCLLSFTSSGISVAATVIADRTPASFVGRRLGSFRLSGDLGLLAGAATAGLLYEHSGRGAAVLLASGVLLASAAACIGLGPDPDRDDAAPADGGLV